MRLRRLHNVRNGNGVPLRDLVGLVREIMLYEDAVMSQIRAEIAIESM